MKYILISLLLVVIALLSYGFYIIDDNASKGNFIVGIGVVVMGFVLMPLFIYHRYKNKDLRDFQLKNFREELHKHNKKE